MVGLISKIGGVRTALRRALEKLNDSRETARLVKQNPWLRDVVGQIDRSKRMLRPRYLQYTNFVSNPGHALSLESCALLHAMCHVMQPRQVLDLGSGFSSYVLRTYQAESNEAVKVRSIDDSPEWLERTRDYLLEKGLSADDLSTLDDLDPSDVGAYDLVTYDMGSMETRRRWLSTVLSYPRPGRGMMIIDDCHFEDFTADVTARVRELGGRSLNLRCLTRDQFGRFAYLVTSLPGATTGGS